MLLNVPYSRVGLPFAVFISRRKTPNRRSSHFPQPFLLAFVFLALSIYSYLCRAEVNAPKRMLLTSAPIALNDEYTGIEDTPMTIVGITANDIVDDGTIDPSTIDLDPNQAGQQTSLVNSFGTYSMAIPSGEITFVPANNWNGITSITYTVNDDEGNTSNVAYIYITISPVMDAPIAMDDYASGFEDDPYIEIPLVHANDIDPEGQGFIIGSIDIDPMTLTQETYYEDATGAWTLDQGLGTIKYFPSPDFNGTAIIGYTIVGFTNMLSNVAMVYVEVVPTNDAPVAEPNTIVVNTGSMALLPNITANDYDLENNIQVNTIDLNPAAAGIQATFTSAQGNWSVDALSGDVTFIANAGFSGTASILYVVSDSLGLESNSAALTAHMIGTNASPIAVNDGATGLEDSPQIQVPNIIANDSDPDGNEQILINSIDIDPIASGQQIALNSANGNWSVDTLTGKLTYVPMANFNGNADIWYSIKDVGGMESTPAHVVITVTPDDDNPIAHADSAQTPLNTTCYINNILDNDYDLESALDPTSVDLNHQEMGIQHTFINDAGQWDYIEADEKVQYTPTVGFMGTAVHEYAVRDINGTRSLPAPLIVEVIPVVPTSTGPVPLHLHHAVVGALTNTNGDEGQSTNTQVENKIVASQNPFMEEEVTRSTKNHLDKANSTALAGTGFYDSNQNCTHDANEPTLFGMQIALNGDQHRIQPNASGYCSLPTHAAHYTMAGINSAYWQNTCTPAEHSDAHQDSPSSFDIPYTPLVHGHDLVVNLVGLSWEANTTRQTTLTYRNAGTVDAENTQLTLRYPEGVNIIDASIPWTTFDGQNYVWDLGLVPLGSVQSITLIDAIHYTPKAGDIMRVEASIRAAGQDLEGANNTCHLDREIQIHSPSNCIQVSPKGVGNDGYIDSHQQLLYTIQFQNNSGHMVRNLRIENTLPPNLDMSTFAIVAASSDYSLVITDERHVTISFADIDLPSSALSQLESQGVISYTVRPLPGALPGEAIENKVTLYFDDEDPLATNEVINTLREQWEDTATQLSLWPNPTSGILHIGLDHVQQNADDQTASHRIEITDSKGRVVKSWDAIAAYQLDFNTSELPAGSYQVRVIDRSGQVHASRFIVMKAVD